MLRKHCVVSEKEMDGVRRPQGGIRKAHILKPEGRDNWVWIER
jgi:hypothetical protein